VAPIPYASSINNPSFSNECVDITRRLPVVRVPGSAPGDRRRSPPERMPVRPPGCGSSLPLDAAPA
jgi:hypothetical protein